MTPKQARLVLEFIRRHFADWPMGADEMCARCQDLNAWLAADAPSPKDMAVYFNAVSRIEGYTE